MANEGNLEPKQPPLRSRLFWYELTAAELLVLQAYVEHSRDGDGKTLWASVPRIAAYTNLSVSQVQRIIGAGPRGDGKDKQGKLIAGGLVARKILLPTARAKPKKMNSASYTLNEAALKMKPKILEYLERDRQRTLPGIHLPTRHGEPIRDEKPSSTPLHAMPPPGRTMRPGYPVLQTSAQSDQTVPLVAPCDQGVDERVTSWSHHATSPGSTMRPALVAPCDQPGRTMRPDPSSYLLGSISLIDSSDPKDSSKTSTSPYVPVEIKNGLREILPSLDDRAISQLWLGCKNNAPDCTVEEVLHFAWEKSPAIFRNNTKNPAGLLIHAVPQCFEGGERSALAHFREQRRQQQERAQAIQRQAEEQQEANREFNRRRDEQSRQAENKLNAMPEAELKLLEQEARAELKKMAPYTPPDALEGQIRQAMLKKIIADPRELHSGMKPWPHDSKPPP